MFDEEERYEDEADEGAVAGVLVLMAFFMMVIVVFSCVLSVV